MSYKKRGTVDGIEYDPMKEPRCAELTTFMRAPLADSLDRPARVGRRAAHAESTE